LDLAPGYSGREKQKERIVPISKNNNRVLSRRGAHELTQEQSEAVSGGIIPTLLSRILTGTVHSPDSGHDR
jgi:hypothetical protein